MLPLKLGLVTGGACNPCNRSSADAGVLVLNEQTNTDRNPASTGIPEWVTSPPKISADPGDGFSIVVGGDCGFSSTFRLPAQNPVPPPSKFSGDVSGINTVNARWSLWPPKYPSV